MDLILLTLAAIAFIVCLVLIDWMRKRHDRVHTARRWDERERLLDRRRPVSSPSEIRQRRARRS